MALKKTDAIYDKNAGRMGGRTDLPTQQKTVLRVCEYKWGNVEGKTELSDNDIFLKIAMKYFHPNVRKTEVRIALNIP